MGCAVHGICLAWRRKRQWGREPIPAILQDALRRMQVTNYSGSEFQATLQALRDQLDYLGQPMAQDLLETIAQLDEKFARDHDR